jgi:hypothetical protein
MNSQQRSLDKIIRKVSPDTKPNSPAEKIVIVDRVKKEILPRKPWFASGDNLDYFLVATTEGGELSNEAICRELETKVFRFTKEIILSINYHVRCNPENAQTFALSVSSTNSPTVEFDKKIQNWTKEFLEGQISDFIDNFAAVKNNLETYLTGRITEIGLTVVDLHTTPQKVSVQDEKKVQASQTAVLSNTTETSQIIKGGKLKTYEPEPITFKVRVSDYDELLKLQATFVLEIDEAKSQEAADNYGKEIKLLTLISDETKKYLLQKSLHEFLYGLDELEGQIKQRLKIPLAAKGRKISYFNLKKDPKDSDVAEKASLELEKRLSLQKYLPIDDYSVDCKISGHNESVRVLNTLQLQLEDVGKFARAVASNLIPYKDGKPSLELWAKQKLQEIIQPLLLEKEYVDILFEFAPREQQLSENSYSGQVKKQIRNAVSAIGYRVTHILSVPSLEPIDLMRDRRAVETGEKDYPTKDGQIIAKLNVVSILKIDNLEKIKKLLGKGVRLEDQIKKAIEIVVSRYMHSIEPDRFYMRFGSYAEELGETISVEQELINLVRRELEESFSAVDIQVTPKIIDTPLLELFKELRRQSSNSFQVKLDSGNGGEISFKGTFQVKYVHEAGWYTFESKFKPLVDIYNQQIENLSLLQRKGLRLGRQEEFGEEDGREIEERIKSIRVKACGVGDIKEAIETYLTAQLESFNFENFWVNPVTKSKVEKALNLLVNNLEDEGSIAKVFGLAVLISNLQIVMGTQKQFEAQKIDNAFDKRIEGIDQEVKQLEDELAKLRSKRLKLVANDDDDDELDKLKTKIKKTQAEIDENLDIKLSIIKRRSSFDLGGLQEKTDKDKDERVDLFWTQRNESLLLESKPALRALMPSKNGKGSSQNRSYSDQANSQTQSSYNTIETTVSDE